MYKTIYGVGGSIVFSASALANVLVPSNDAYSQLQGVLGEAGTDYTYMLASNGVSLELIKVVQLNTGLLTVERGQDGTTPISLPIGTTLSFGLSQLGVQDIIDAKLAAAALPASLSFAINSPNTVSVASGIVTIDIPLVPLYSDETMDVIQEGDGYRFEIIRGAFDCTPLP